MSASMHAQTVILSLRRKIYTNNSIIGDLYYNNDYECVTLEDAHMIDNVKVPGQTAIPTGTYRVVYNMSPKFQQLMPLLIGVPYFEGVRIHIGNSPKDTQGCILVGSTYPKSQPDWISQSAAAFTDLDRKLKAAFDAGSLITISINDSVDFLSGGGKIS